MVNNVEYEVSVDEQGRMVIPAPLRKLMGLSKGGRVAIKYRNGRLEIISIDKDLEKRVKWWVETVLKISPKPFSEKVEESWKWIGREYAERKLGIR